MIKFLLLPVVCIIIASGEVFAQADTTSAKGTAYGLGVGYVAGFHAADFRSLPGVPNCCPNFTSGSGGGFSAWIFGEIQAEQAMRLGGRAVVSRHSADFEVAEQTTVIIGDRTELATITHRLETSLSRIGVEPYLAARLGGFGLNAGLGLGFAVSPTYQQRETVSPGKFGDGQNVRNQFSGTVQQSSSFYADFVAGIGYSVPLNARKSAFLMPEVRLNYGLTDIVNGYLWSANTVTVGLTLRFEPTTSAAAPPAPPPPPQPEPPKPRPTATTISRLNASFDIAAIYDEDAAELSFRIEEFVSTQMYPLLNYIFFDELGSEIPKRYNSSGATSDSEGSGELSAYYDVLNIIAERMQATPQARLTVTGCNAGTGRERGDVRLSRSRATAVKNYLSERKGIGPERIRIEARGLPERASNADRPEGAAENRRVEIVSDDESILAPRYVRDTVRGLPKGIRIRPTVSNASEINNWQFSISQYGRTVADWKAKGAPPYELTISSRLTELRNVDGLEPLTCTFTAFSSDGREIAKAESSMPVEYVTLEQKRSVRAADKEIERFRLMLFDFDQSEPGTANRRTIREIAERITPQSAVNIVGATDAAGDPDYNKRLSLARANAVARILGSNRAIIEGAGAVGGEFDNALPEARFYNRNVSVEVISPAKK